MDHTPDKSSPKFPRRFRGYDRDAVDTTVHELASRVASRTEECDELRCQLADAERERNRLAAMEDSISRALVSAHRAAQETGEAARREGDDIVREAKAKAAKIIEEAEARADAAALQRARFERELRDLMARVTAELESQAADRDKPAEAPVAAAAPTPPPASPAPTVSNGSSVTISSVKPTAPIDVFTSLRTGTDGPRLG